MGAVPPRRPVVELRGRGCLLTAQSARIMPGSAQHRGTGAPWSLCPANFREMAAAARNSRRRRRARAARDGRGNTSAGTALRCAPRVDGQGWRRGSGEKAADLVILDINMPGEDGLTLARRLREHSDVCIMMLTAAAQTVDRVVGLGDGRRRLHRQALRPARAASAWCAPYCAAALRRRPAVPGPSRRATPCRFGHWLLDLDAHKLIGEDGGELRLTQWSSTCWTPLPGTPTGAVAQPAARPGASRATGSPSTAASTSAWRGSARRSSATRQSRKSSRRYPGPATCMSARKMSGNPPNSKAGRFPGLDEAKLLALLDAIPARVAFIDRDRRHLYANREYAETIGMPAEASSSARPSLTSLGEESYRDDEAVR